MLPLAIALTLLSPTHLLASGDDWPQWRGPERDGIWRETGVLTEFPESGLPVKWRAPISAGYSGPTVADGRVYVTDRVTEPKETERVHCFNWETGETLWTHEYDCEYAGVSYDAGPRCSVLVHDGRAYSLGATGRLFCFDAESGKVLWGHDLNEIYQIDMPIWGIAASPIIEGDLLIVPASGKEAWLVAFDAKSGEERWKAFDDRGNYSAPIIVEQGGERVLVCWSGDRIVGVNPQSGSLFWEIPFKAKRIPLGVASPVPYGDTVFFTGFYDGSVLIELDQEEPKATQAWHRVGPNERRTDALQSIISTPLIKDGHVYGVDSYGELRCLTLVDGDRVWEDQTAVPRARWSTIHFVENGDLTWMFNERGELLIAKLSPEGFEEISRTKIIEPTLGQLNQREGVCWSHPAFAYRHVFARNDEELVCVDVSSR